MQRRWGGFTLFLNDGTVCLTNNAAEWALRRHVLPDRDMPHEQCRSGSLATRRARPPAGSSREATARTASVELEKAPPGHRVLATSTTAIEN